MSDKVLRDLTSDEFRLSLGIVTSAAGLWRCLHKSSYVSRLRAALRRGEVTETAIRRFVGELSARFQRGSAFFDEPALAAIAVALQSTHSHFATEYLSDLSRLRRIAELHLAPGVASLCLRDRDRSHRYQSRRACWGRAADDSWKVTLRRSQPLAPRACEDAKDTVPRRAKRQHASS